MSLKTTTQPIPNPKARKNASTKVAASKKQAQKPIEAEVTPSLEDELGPVAYYTQEAEDEFLRQMFDFLESINIKNARRIYYSVPRKYWSIGMALAASLVLVWALGFLMNTALAQLAWENRPSVMERLTAPYEVDTHITPTLDLTVESGILPAAVGSYSNQLLVADANGVLPEFADVTARIRSDNGSSFNAVTRGLTYVDNLVGLCLLSTAGTAVSDCGLPRLARYAEAASYVSGGDTVTVSVAQFANNEQTAQAFSQLYEFSRLVGVIGNFAIVESRSVDYYYSSTRNNFYFTWTNGTWIYSVNSASLNAIDSFMNEFPY